MPGGVLLTDQVQDALELLRRRIASDAEDLVERMVERYRAEIVDYGALDAEGLREVARTSLENVRWFVDNLEQERSLPPEQLEAMQAGAARRVHMGVSFEALLHALRIWGRVLWQSILDTARLDRKAERDAALILAGRVLEHVDTFSIASAQGYFDEAHGLLADREVMRRELLDALLIEHVDPDALVRDAAALGLDVGGSYLVIVARGMASADGDSERVSLSRRVALREIVHVARSRLKPPAGSLLIGVRQDEVVALYPAPSPTAVDAIKRECEQFADAIAARRFSVAVGGWHPGLHGVRLGYADAREAIEHALVGGVQGRIVAFDDIVVACGLRSHPQTERMLSDLLAPLREYDASKRAELESTLRSYFTSGYSVRRTARELHVNPNTVVYRLQRIQDLTGRDPREPEDLLLLVLGLKLGEEAEGKTQDSSRAS